MPTPAKVPETDGDSATKMVITHNEEARIREEEKALNLIQAFKRWPRLSAYCLALTSAILLWGYDIAMSGSLSGLDQFKYAFCPRAVRIYSRPDCR